MPFGVRVGVNPSIPTYKKKAAQNSALPSLQGPLSPTPQSSLRSQRCGEAPRRGGGHAWEALAKHRGKGRDENEKRDGRYPGYRPGIRGQNHCTPWGRNPRRKLNSQRWKELPLPEIQINERINEKRSIPICVLSVLSSYLMMKRNLTSACLHTKYGPLKPHFIAGLARHASQLIRTNLAAPDTESCLHTSAPLGIQLPQPGAPLPPLKF